jgi:hypothetical protein
MPATCEPSGTTTQDQRGGQKSGFRPQLQLIPPPERTAQAGECSPAATAGKKTGRWRIAAVVVLLLLVGGLLFCHGCHRDEDNELRAAVLRLFNR